MFQKLWGLFHITNFATLIRPYVFLNFIIGYFPYKITSTTYTISKIRFVCSTIVLIVCTVATLCGLYWRIFVCFNVETSVLIHMVFIFSFGIIVIWTRYVSLPSKLHLFRILSETSRVLSPEEFSKAKWMLLLDILRLMLYLSFLLNPMLEDSSYLFYSISFYMFLVSLLENLMFVICLFVLKLCLLNVNTTLTNLKQTLINDEPHLLRRIYHTQKNSALLTKLKTLRKQHLELGKVIETLNEAFGMENIVIIVLTIVDMTFNLYSYLVYNTDEGKIVRIWSQNIEYLMYHGFNIAVVTFVCEKIKDQTKYVGFNIHRILVVTFDEQISAELELFSMQAIQQDHTILAKGLVLDVTLLTKIVGIITTYLLILIQFLLVKPC